MNRIHTALVLVAFLGGMAAQCASNTANRRESRASDAIANRTDGSAANDANTSTAPKCCTVRVTDFGAMGDGNTDDTAAFKAALAASNVVHVPDPKVSYRIATTLPVHSHKRLIGIGGQIPIKAESALLFEFDGTKEAVIEGFHITGPHDGTSYQICLTNGATKNVLSDLVLANGNSGISVTNSFDNTVRRVSMTGMRGTGIKLTGAATHSNRVLDCHFVNLIGFGVLIEDKAAKSQVNTVSKRLDVSTVTAYQKSNRAAELAVGRLGLECVGIRDGSNGNVLVNILAQHCHDNGLSITGSHNSLTGIQARNNYHDGIHLYGSYNALSGIVVDSNRLSGLGIGGGATKGRGHRNTAFGVSGHGNGRYGVEMKDAASLNHVSGVAAFNKLGNYGNSSKGSNTVRAL